MTLLNAFYGTAACYALFRFLLLPLSQALWNNAPIDAKLRNAPIVAALEKLTHAPELKLPRLDAYYGSLRELTTLLDLDLSRMQ